MRAPVGWRAEIRVKVGALFFFFFGGRGRAAGEGFGRGDPCLVFWMVVLVDEGVQTDCRAGLV